jgi:3D (Asp-Asp-Asp) domain-containing protein
VVRFALTRAAMTARSGQSVVVHGRVIAAARRIEIRLLARQGGGWRVVGRGRAGRDGRFHIGYTVDAVGTISLRVSVAAHGLSHSSAPAGQVVGLAPAVASWYYDGGNTACGFHATYGVANRTLPCGTRVTISYDGRSVVATVDDRGPFVYGRSLDLNQNTARALGMYGVAQVLTSV